MLLLTEKVRRVIDASPVPMTAGQITAALSANPGSVGGSLGRLHLMRVVTRVKIPRAGYPYSGLWAYSIAKTKDDP